MADRMVAVVTGGAGGIGAALAHRLASRGAAVAVWDVDADGAAGTAAGLPGQGHLAVAVDVADGDAVRAAAADTVAALGDPRIVLLNAGVYAQGGLEQLDDAALRWVIGVNLWGVLHGARALLPSLRRTAPARLGVVLSGLAFAGLPGKGAYSLTKSASQAVAATLRAELYGSGVTVTSVYPPAVDTGLVRHARAVDPDQQAREVAEVARLAWPAERVAAVALRGVARGVPRVVIGKEARLLDVAHRVAPGWLPDLLGRYAHLLP